MLYFIVITAQSENGLIVPFYSLSIEGRQKFVKNHFVKMVSTFLAALFLISSVKSR